VRTLEVKVARIDERELSLPLRVAQQVAVALENVEARAWTRRERWLAVAGGIGVVASLTIQILGLFSGGGAG